MMMAKVRADNKEALGRPFVSAVQIKIVTNINIKFQFVALQRTR